MKLYGEKSGEESNNDPWQELIDGSKPGFPLHADEARVIHHDERQSPLVEKGRISRLGRASIIDFDHMDTGRHVKKPSGIATPLPETTASKDNNSAPRHRAES